VKYVYTALMAFALGVVLTGAGALYYHKKHPVTITQHSAPEIHYIKQIEKTDTAGLWSCYRAPIALSMSYTKPVAYVAATDGCKETKQTFDIPVAMTDTVQFKVGIGVTAALLSGYGVYKLVHK
jgi:hypothetical protein